MIGAFSLLVLSSGFATLLFKVDARGLEIERLHLGLGGKPVAEKSKLRQQVYTKAALSYSDQVKAVRAMKAAIEGDPNGPDEAVKEAKAAAFDFNDR